MTWDAADGIFNLRFDPVFTAAIASMVFIFGAWLRTKVAFLRRFCIPAGVVGGICTASFAFSLYYPQIAVIHFDQTLQMPMIAIFFTRIGLTGSFQLIKRGGWVLFIYLCICWGLAIFQNILGVLVAQIFGIHPVLGVMAGAVSLEGGHNLAVVFGPMAEALGVSGAKVVAVSAATYGLIAGGLLGAPIANWLIKRHNLELQTSYDALYKGYHDCGENESIELYNFLYALGLLLALMALGRWGAEWLQNRARTGWLWENFTFPGYLGAMFLAVLFRNLNDIFKIVRIHQKALDLISTVAVSLFLSVSMMSLKIGDLYGLAIPLLVILVAQTLAIVFITLVFLFPLMGKDYDAAIICSGFIGHGLGAPPSAVSMMRASCDHHNVMSYKAFLIVPLCGAVLIDLVALPNIIWFIKTFAK